MIDYKIINYMVADEGVQELIENHRLLTDVDEELWKKGALSVAARYCLTTCLRKAGIKHAVSLHRSIRSASRFADQQQAFTAKDIPPLGFHISSRNRQASTSEAPTLMVIYRDAFWQVLQNFAARLPSLAMLALFERWVTCNGSLLVVGGTVAVWSVKRRGSSR